MKIICYYCKRSKGEAYKKKVVKKVKNKKTGEVELRIKDVWKANGFKSMNPPKRWLCDKCDRRKCERCGILLSNKHVCANVNCRKKHGAYYKEHPNYCKECWDIIKNEQIRN